MRVDSRLLFCCVLGNILPTQAVKLGLLAVFNDPKTWMSLHNVGSAINIANDQLIMDGVIPNETFSIAWRDTYSESDGVGNTVNLVLDDNVDVIFGSPSSRVCVATGHLTAHWNFPHISWGANSYTLSDKRLYRTFVRTSGPISEVGNALVTLFKNFNWNKVGFLYIDYGICSYTAHGTRSEFAKYNITEMQNIGYSRDTLLTDSVIDNYLRLLKQTTRIIFICVDSELRRFLLRACKYIGMCNGEFLFITATLGKPSESLWSKGDARDEEAKYAFKYLFYISTATWVGEGAKEKLAQFDLEVIERMADPPWNTDYAKRNNQSASSQSQYLYDATYFYGLWLNYTRETGIDLRNGTAMMQFSKGLSFKGIAGSCDIGDNGDRIPYFWIYQFFNGTPEVVAIAETPLKVISDTIGFTWFTFDNKPPLDAPVCGYFNELCVKEIQDNSTTIIAALMTVFVVIFVTSGTAYIIRKRQIENMMIQSIWKVDISEIELLKSVMGFGSRINFKSQGGLSHVSQASEPNTLTNTKPTMTRIGMMRGQEVAVRNVAKINTAMLSRNDLIQLKTMRQLVHDNINPFVGATFDVASPCIMFVYCRKGSLQDILENDDIQLDSSFKFSLTMDLVKGMIYIHSSKLMRHGRLKSSNCLVDGRWVVKITDYGICRFLEEKKTNNVEENEYYKSLLWTAPELLNDQAANTDGTKESDVYSFGIIMHEIFYRLGPFAGLSHMTAKDVIGRVKNREVNPCRPEVFNDVTDVSVHVQKLMRSCWNDNETERPSFSVIRSYLNENMKGRQSNIVDIIMQRLEKYASNLEDLVDQRTQQLMIEKQKADKLLYRMLPPTCADKLKMGEPVHPEIYDSSTVFFSDIVGFTSICAKSSPIQVVDFLNDLYSCFDDIIAKHDAYKVETIGDSYLVVSGVPTRNGNLHAGVIADMSIDIRAGVGNFKLKHLPHEPIRVRIGVHTGPCCAGVVGMSMPRYCLFGDTINTASRMESNGESMKIHVSEYTHSALKLLGGYYTTFRAEIPVKGKGLMRTYWLTGKEGLDISDESNS